MRKSNTRFAQRALGVKKKSLRPREAHALVHNKDFQAQVNRTVKGLTFAAFHLWVHPLRERLFPKIFKKEEA